MTDHETYTRLQSFMRQALRAGTFPSEEFDDAWTEAEKIKNRWGGMPPPDPDFDYEAEAMANAEMANMIGTR